MSADCVDIAMGVETGLSAILSKAKESDKEKNAAFLRQVYLITLSKYNGEVTSRHAHLEAQAAVRLALGLNLTY